MRKLKMDFFRCLSACLLLAVILLPHIGQARESQISVSPGSHGFGEVDVRKISPVQSFDVSNNGDTDLQIIKITISGTDRTEFSIKPETDNCNPGKIITPSEKCTFEAVLLPESEGSKSANINIESDDPNTPNLSIPLTGTGVPATGTPNISIDSALHDFHYVEVEISSESHAFQISNTGDANLIIDSPIHFTGDNSDEFAIQSEDCSGNTIPPSGTCTIKIFFLPKSEGSKSASVIVMSDDPDTENLSISLTGNGGQPPDSPNISTDLILHGFGPVTSGNTSAAQSFVVSNTGTANLILGEIMIENGADAAEFAIQDDNCSDQELLPSGNCSLEAVFKPASQGDKSANIMIPSDDPDTAILRIQLTGTGALPADSPDISASPALHGFNVVNIGTTSPARAFEISNNGTADLDIGNITIGGTDPAEFAIQDNCSDKKLTPSGTCSLEAVFKPTSEGDKSANIEIPSNDPDTSALLIPLSGTGAHPGDDPNISATPGSYNFNNVSTGTSSLPKSFDITNTGAADLVMQSVTVTGKDAADFVIQDDTCSEKTLSQSGICSLKLVFSPASEGPGSANIEIPSNDPDMPTLVIPLAGTGTQPGNDPKISATLISYNFNDVSVQTSSLARSFDISNTGTGALAIGPVRITGKDAADFAIQDDDTCSDQTVGPSGNCKFKVVFSPEAEGNKNANIEIPSNDPGTPMLIIQLAGRAIKQGTGSSNISITPSSHAFGPVYSGSSSPPRTFEITNTGVTDLIMAPVNITGMNAAAFSIVKTNCSWEPVKPSESCMFDAIFSPASKGSKNANFEILSNDPDMSPLVIPVSGIGVRVWTVCDTDDCNYASVQAAIDGASDGDTVLVGHGTYSEDINFKGKDITLTVSKDSSGCDINGDGNVGLEEVIHTLRILVGAD